MILKGSQAPSLDPSSPLRFPSGSPPGSHLLDQAGKLQVCRLGDVEDGAVGVLTPVLQQGLHSHPAPRALYDENRGVKGQRVRGAVLHRLPQHPPAVLPEGRDGRGSGTQAGKGTVGLRLPASPLQRRVSLLALAARRLRAQDRDSPGP